MSTRTLARFRHLLTGLLILIVVLVVILLRPVPTSQAALSYTTSWIGNTFGTPAQHVKQDVLGMFTSADGTVYTNSNWDENGHEASSYKNGQLATVFGDLHGWGRVGGNAIVANSSYVYVVIEQGGCDGGNTNLNQNGLRNYPDCGTTWYAIRRYNHDGSRSPFSTGHGWDGSMLIVTTSGTLSGIAINGNRLYVSNPAESKINVYDTGNMTPVTTWNVSRAGQMAFDSHGMLWVIQNGDASNAPRILRFNTSGQQQSQQITGIDDPTALAADNQGRLLIADDSAHELIRIYNNLNGSPTQVSTFGQDGGLFSGTPGIVGPLRFSNLTGVGIDSSGNIYITEDLTTSAGGTVIESYTSSGTRLWRLDGLEFLDNADIDPATDGADVYTKEEHFTMDYSKPAGKQWTFKGYTVNRFKYPQDPRLHTVPTSTWARRVQGNLLLYMVDQYSSFLQVYRFNPSTDGEIAIPSVMFSGHRDSAWPANQPSNDFWIWRDGNGNGGFDSGEYDGYSGDNPHAWGWWVDANGTVWKANREGGIRSFPMQGFDSHGNPIYTAASSQLEANPAPFHTENTYRGDINRLEYVPATDTMYLAGYTSNYQNSNNNWGIIGKLVVRYDNWSSGNRTPRWQLAVPFKTGPDDNPKIYPSSLSIAGDYLFVGEVLTATVDIYTVNTAQKVGTISPGPEVGSTSGWLDIPYSVRAAKRSSGEYLIFVEEDLAAKVMLYRWYPDGNGGAFSTGFESGQPQPTWTNAVDDGGQPAGGINNVNGICCGLSGPETDTRNETAHNGTAVLMYSGYDNNSSGAFAYMKAFDVNLPVSTNTQLSYWIYPQSSATSGLVSGSNSSCVAIDLIFSDGTSLRDSGVTDQSGNRVHPAHQCGHLTMDTWNQVSANLSTVSGKTIIRIDVGYDQPANTGGYRGYLDDIAVS